MAQVHVYHGTKEAKILLLVVKDEGPNLLGQDWLQHLKLDWQQINKLHSEALHQVLQRYMYEDIFKQDLHVGTL